MAVIVDPVTGRRTVNYTSGEYEDVYSAPTGPFSPFQKNKYLGRRTFWNAEAEANSILGGSNHLETMSGDPAMKELMESENGKKLREHNTEFASYYQAYMQEENQRRNIAKAFGVQNTVLTGSGTITGAEASKKGTVLGGGQ